jgi:hypothetical protein
MARSRSTDDPFDVLRKVALSRPEAEESLACRGTAIESASFRVRGKSFLFLSPAKVMVKLETSQGEASELERRHPAACKTGKGGWTTAALSVPGGAPLKTLERWIAESHALAAGAASKISSRRKKGAGRESDPQRVTKRGTPLGRARARGSGRADPGRLPRGS